MKYVYVKCRVLWVSGEEIKEFKVEGCNAILRYHDLPGSEAPIIFIHGIGCASSFDYPAVAASEYLHPHRRILVDGVGQRERASRSH